MPGKWYSQLYDLALDQFGYITSIDAKTAGAGRDVLVHMARAGHLERVSHGLYRFTLTPHEPNAHLMEAVLWSRSLGVLSHDSALDLWDVSVVSPHHRHLTVPVGTRLRRKTPQPIYEIHQADLDEHEKTVWEGIPTTTLARTIRDCWRRLDSRILTQAVQNGRRHGYLSRTEHEELETQLEATCGRHPI